MPGIYGFVERDGVADPLTMLDRMAEALKPTPNAVKEFHSEDGFGFGRVSLGMMNPEPQPIWNADKSLALVLEGEIYSKAIQTESNEFSFHSNGKGRAGQQLASILHQSNPETLSALDGAFVAAIWESESRTLTIVNDRLGLQPVYYARIGSGLLFASGVRALLCHPRLDRETDRVAIAEFMTFDHVLGQRTFLKSVSLLPQGSVLTFHNGELNIRSYWKPTPRPFQVRVNPEQAFSRIVPLLEQAIMRQAPQGEPAGLLLSGGLDSRMMLALMSEADFARELSTYTWGIPGCDDARFAQKAAHKAGVSHQFIELKPDWLLHQAIRGVKATDGMANVVNLHALANLDQIGQSSSLLYKGFLGDAMFGFGLTRRYWADYARKDSLQVHLDAYRDYDVLTFDVPSHEDLFSQDFRAEIGQELLADYQAVIDQAGTESLALQRIFIDFTQRVPRMTLNGVLVARERATVRLPFADNQIVDFALSLAPGLLFDRQVMKEGFRRAYPQLAQVPVAPGGLPMMACALDVLLRSQKLLQWHLQQRGMGWLAGPVSRPYKDYNLWFRTVLRDWIESVLLDSPFLERGYFQPEFARKVIQDHMGGANNAVRLGAFISLELWHQLFLDEPTGAIEQLLSEAPSSHQE